MIISNAQRLINVFIASIYASTVYGYEVGTHARITDAAYDQSILSDSSLLLELDIVDSVNAFGSDYYDVTDTNIKSRQWSFYEQKNERMPDGSEPLSVKGWLLRGAIREDDLGTIFGLKLGGDSPREDPYGDFYRVYQHFFDPTKLTPQTQALNGTPMPDDNPQPIHSSPNWALGTLDAFATGPIYELGRRNHFTIQDAREAMYRALTGRATNGSIGTDIMPDGNGGGVAPANTAEAEQTRNAYWATVFRSLGDVVHLVQDAAQPQHTRNEAHSPINGAGRQALERQTDLRAKSSVFKCFNGRLRPVKPVTYNTYPVPDLGQIDTYAGFFSSGPGSVATGTGLAEYSNRGFFTAGNNLGDTNYSSPADDPNVYLKQLKLETDNCLLPSANNVGKELFYGTVTDTLNPGYADPGYTPAPGGDARTVPLSARGLWHVPGTQPGTYLVTNAYTLTRENHIATADHLIPRAVSYSAGLINYFFRGRIALLRDLVDLNTYYIKNNSQETATGDFTLYYDATDGLRYAVPGATWTIASLAPDTKSAAVTFTPPTTPPPAAPNEYMLVFRGDLGNETDDNGAVGAVIGRRVCFPAAVGPVSATSLAIDCDGTVWGWGSIFMACCGIRQARNRN